ncbi:diguanylate cyclase domain-containing protein [Variovorax sp. HJSM1_2]|uniref:diguanylate cyclase domain-containing protein n=1 Tax=Variovorax sp. HJSM1_2 TaxID=3366263 RepID=UPI003BECC9EF
MATPLAHSQDSQDDRKPYKQAWLGLAVFLVLALGLGIFQLYIGYQRITQEEHSRLQTQARVVADNLARQFDGVNNALASVRYDLVAGDTPGESTYAPSRLKALADAMPGVRGIAVLNASGTMAITDRPELRGMNFRERSYFSAAQKDPDYSRLYVSPPFKSMGGVYSISLSKAIQAVNGDFAGVVTANLNPEYFEILAKSVLYAPDMQVGVVHASARLFVDARHDEALLGRDLSASTSLFSQHVASGREESTFEGISAATGDDRLMVLHTVAPQALRMDSPLVVQLSRKPSAIYAAWRDDVAMYAVLFALLTLGSCTALYFAQQSAMAKSRGDQVRRRLERENALRFEFGLKSAALGLWDRRLDVNTFTVNSRELEILGYHHGEIEVNAENWRKLVHPDDLTAVYDGFSEHMKNSTEPYRVTHRMLHKDGRLVWVLAHVMVVERDVHGQAMRVLGTHMDITERVQMDATLRDSEQRLALAMKTGKMGLIDWHVASDQVLFNSRAYEILGLEPEGERLNLAAWSALRHPDDAERADVLLQGMLSGALANADIEYRVRHKDGHYLWVHLRAETIERGEQNQPLRVMATFRNVSARKAAEFELKRVNEQLERLTVTDGLTGVGNRRLFDKTLQEEWQRCARHGLPLGLLMVDIDHFKKYNDSYGHQGGDVVLASVADILKRCVQRSGELVARYGGEEFALLLPSSDMAACVVMARHCLAALQEATIPHKASPVSPWVSLSIGLASVVPDASQSASSLLKTADAALYEAKRLGRNRYAPAETEP